MLTLKKLELLGFKSFGDREELHFSGSGIASVVGPNGCGKSNISDAISWVLGEQSAKSLRGSRMQDVIFNGTRDRQPSGLATVSLTLKDPDAPKEPPNGKPPAPRDITVTRKLFRSGESSYLINGKNCRLRDVHDLFMGTGLGPNHYAIIEQGRIGQVLSSKPLDRRSLIEEAAGVTKFKTRKRLAELKLESARQNLHRVNDILQEVTRQANSLKRQAAKARRYEELRQELTTALSAALSSRQRRLSAASKEVGAELAAAEAEYQRQAGRLQSLESDLASGRGREKTLETELEQARQNLAQLTVETERLRSRIEQQGRSAEDSAERRRQAEAEAASLAEQLERLAAEQERDQKAARGLEAESQKLRQNLEEQSRGLEQRQSQLRQAEAEQEAARKRVITLLGEVAQLRNQAAKIEEFLAGNERQISRAAAEESAAREEAQQWEERRTEATATAASRREELERLRAEAAEVDRRIAELREKLREDRSQSENLQRDLSRLRARRESLDEILAHHSYTTQTVKQLFAAAEAGSIELRPRGVLADLLDVDPRYERAAEEFLREELEHVVVETWDDARQGVELVRSRLQGRATFFVRQAAAAAAPAPELAGRPGLLGRLADFVELNEPLGLKAGELLPKLQACFLVEDGASAEPLALERPDLYFLLPDGVCYRGRTISGGRAGSAGPLALKRELRELRPKVDAAEARFEENREAIAAAEEAIRALNAERDERRLDLSQRERDVLGLEHEVRRIDEQLERARRRAAASEQEAQRLRRDAERAQAERKARETEIAEAERQRETAEHSLSGLGEMLEQAREELRGLAESQAQLRAETAALEERRRAAAAALDRLRRTHHEQEQRRAHAEAQAHRWQGERERLLADNEALANDVSSREKRHGELQEAVANLAKELEASRQGTSSREEQSQALRADLEQARARRSAAEVRRVEVESDLRHLEETCRRELNRPIAEVAADGKELSEEELAEAEAEYGRLKEKIERLGPVNVLALEEYEEASQRQEFLETQEADLLSSIRDTQAAISEIDTASKKQFREAFEAINEHFRHIFTTLFGGGLGEMRLAEEEGDGDPGVDIVASPPGKRLQSVALLSGGEKSLTALALLMAIFRYKPSPFCVLDEVDAALDEPNIRRFRRLLEDMSDRTQFILITHSKTTMASAQALYGVTMPQPGVSKVVSVRMSDHARATQAQPEMAGQAALVGA